VCVYFREGKILVHFVCKEGLPFIATWLPLFDET